MKQLVAKSPLSRKNIIKNNHESSLKTNKIKKVSFGAIFTYLQAQADENCLLLDYTQ